MFVLPCRPQAPLTGVKTSGLIRTNSFCSFGFSFTTAQFSSGYPIVAKIFCATRKSGWRMCADSIASGKLSASLRKSSGVMGSPTLSRCNVCSIQRQLSLEKKQRQSKRYADHQCPNRRQLEKPHSQAFPFCLNKPDQHNRGNDHIHRKKRADSIGKQFTNKQPNI